MDVYWPVSKLNWDSLGAWISSGFGKRTYKNAQGKIVTDFHDGIDLAVASGKPGCPIIAPVSGPIKAVYDPNGALGSYITAADGKGHYMAHFNDKIIVSGHVEAGQEIAHMGKTGNTTGVHCHWEVHQIANNWKSQIDPRTLNPQFFTSNLPINKYEMVALQKPIKLKSLGKLEIRLEPNKVATDIGDVLLGQIWQTNKVTQGQMINENGRSTDVWYSSPDGRGWVNGTWLDELQDTQIPADYESNKVALNAANQKIVAALIQAKETVAALS